MSEEVPLAAFERQHERLMFAVEQCNALEGENARFREALKAIDSGVRSGPYRDYGASYEALRAIARAALGEEAA